MNLDGKVVIVTGAAGLIGREFTQHLFNQGASVVLADKNIKKAEELSSALNKIRPNGSISVFVDITNKDSIQKMIQIVVSRYSKIDTLINNAYPRNKNYGRKLEDVEFSDFSENLSLHLGGYFLMCQQLCLHFKAQGHGNIVNIGSIYGVIPPRFEIYEGVNFSMPVEYAAIKSGILHLTRYFAQFYKKNDIRVNSLCPGGVFDHQPEPFLSKYNKHCGVKGMLDPRDLVGTLAFLVSDESKFMNGQNLIVDDGFIL